MHNSLLRRPRRNRTTEALRQLVAETQLSTTDLLYPLFLIEGHNKRVEVDSMPGIFRFSADELLAEVERSLALGIKSFAVFPSLPESKKDKLATEGYRENSLYLETLAKVKQQFPEVVLMTDIAMDPYSSDGHDGIYRDGEIVNDETLEILAKMALAQAQTGADLLGPSDMMDGRVHKIRTSLDAAGYHTVGILSYAAKYASAFYGPFRDALDSAPKYGDKKTYQMNPANVREALLEAQLDFDEGADMLMVKPALSYLDVIKELSDNFPLPIAAYNVSGEFAMIKAAAQKGWLDEQSTMLEVLLSIKRAGAKVILTYFAPQAAPLIRAAG